MGYAMASSFKLRPALALFRLAFRRSRSKRRRRRLAKLGTGLAIRYHHSMDRHCEPDISQAER